MHSPQYQLHTSIAEIPDIFNYLNTLSTTEGLGRFKLHALSSSLKAQDTQRSVQYVLFFKLMNVTACMTLAIYVEKEAMQLYSITFVYGVTVDA